ncbi:MAG TPA: prepilin-type N-terminal cleavage/methylation domain-containing protein [Candidatus Paceibacterota bacterium]|nr:prepilin-type N-terminal cleavage/methylation domain-containing protein [Candidatus Paceibacterota bacterium]
MEPFHLRFSTALKAFSAGFTSKHVSQRGDSDFFFVNERREQVRSSGFTLVELLVVLAIMIIITTIALTSQSSFNKTLILANTAYDIGLTLRSAEIFGIGSRALETSANTGYGIHFTMGNSLTLFADVYPSVGSNPSTLCHSPPSYDPTGPSAEPGNCAYDPGLDTVVQTYTLGNGIVVSDFCAYASGSESCAVAHGGGLSSLDVVFARPNPIPFITANGAPYTSACVTVTSPQGGFRYVSVAASGEITANATSCP